MPSKVRASGPIDAEVMIVGEAPGAEEERQGIPFVGESGKELDRMLHETGFLRSHCYVTNVCRYRPPRNDIDNFYLKNTPQNRIPGPEILEGMKELADEIDLVKPRLILALGDTALWALTGNRGITRWRGSELIYTSVASGHRCWLVPSYHPAGILRMWDWRFAALCDLRRAKKRLDSFPDFSFPPKAYHIRPSFAAVHALLTELVDVAHCRISADIETRAGHIACIGFGVDKERAFCIPFMCIEKHDGYWEEEEEIAIVHLLRRVFRNPNIDWVFQNGLFDLQYIARYWGVIPKVYLDTMLAHHACFTGLPKSLDFLSSIYCERHIYWKEDGKYWEKGMDEEQLWRYNCEDCVRTWEISFEIEAMALSLSRMEQVRFQMEQFLPTLRMMLRGVRCNLKVKADLTLSLGEAKRQREVWINQAVGRPFKVTSPKQMQSLFYDEIGLPVLRNRKTGSPTMDDEALEKIAKRAIWLRPLIRRIQELRSIGVFLGTFVTMGLDRDGRIHCSYNIAGTETLRWSSSKSAFDSGTNLQNIPAGDEDEEGGKDLPNVRKMFIPDTGCEWADLDLKGADAQIVAWEANDDLLKAVFLSGENLHLENAKILFTGQRVEKNSHKYNMAKRGVHATNYGSGPRTLAISLGITVHEAESFQRRWFAAHPGIKDWQDRIADSLSTTRSVRNAFGFVRHYFGRIEGLLPEALAWGPQSTVAHIISKGLIRIDRELPDVQVLLQVHDSLDVQYPEWKSMSLLPKIKECMTVVVPYEDPLTVPISIKTSKISWGDCA